ncbi:DUF5107 domain-containing protein [Bariatricus massiliensis]|uniref:DUF5107 domain-containing protein n=1 Tax=Bariatricus massiliensis TaxID=1745713 RepID=A0ABS8DGH8_9FIRM|nr:DUF5107 domain-containing protein [Bariatricus massiliensis]MCB7304365.1 DUF5107 domain-containing protein [Bariatricus massiliensis]MCB7375016.1 DUF5107 domain-containing protein [Bariatricus massiliensis]MCB7387475.1 DUF5107 domain-containing protein [Bariatricus massiliensis]MCB7411637.1 DUF5107 domain-containing protein [Bariatricus massiliensis]MCQ5253772.1 DUF5107 domain-containing protein [Bariatricus massiliensis]
MNEVKIWEENVVIPTYEVGEPDKNPMFLEKRVYQGSSGKVYPYPTIEKISHEKKDKTYRVVYLENEYLKVMVLPELGGRIQRAYDKTNGYDFVYYNHVIKPALVGLVGPWISGGIEFNWPQHHRPTTYMPVDYLIQENEGGSKTLLVNDVDQMYGTKGIAGFTLYPDKAYIEIRGQLYNRTAMPQTFLWWANPAVPVNDYTQSIFPPDVHSVMDHGKRDVSRFPIAKGVYYKHDYSEGVDISRYKNIPVPTSYMAEKSDYDFVGGYDYRQEAGILHVADHHISPGKKQWTWGCGEFGQAWDRNLTDEDGPYIELMTGVYTDNQPDFTWLKPFEEKTFRQYFMPYKKVGSVKNATINAVLGVEVADGKTQVTVYATGRYEDAKVSVYHKGQLVSEEEAVLSPCDIYEKSIEISGAKASDVKVEVCSGDKLLVAYQAKEEGIPELAKPAQAAKDPEEIMTNEELFLTGQHIEQYRHATYLPDSYYLEGLKRDEGDIRINNAYGLLLFRRGCFAEAERHFRKAIERLTRKNPNPYDSEAYYLLGVALFYQSKNDEAFDAFYKATWSNEQQEMSFYYLAAIEMLRGNYTEALEFVEKGLVKNAHNIKARGAKVVILRKLGRIEEAKAQALDNLKVDGFDYLSRFELAQLSGEDKENILEEMNALMRDFHENYLQTARDYAEAGCFEEAVEILNQCTKEAPMLAYYKAHYLQKMGYAEKAQTEYANANACSPLYCFPNKLEDIAVLEGAMEHFSQGAKAYYYLGNLCYDKLQFERAALLWEKSIELDGSYPTVHRNLALAYYNKQGNIEGARREMEKAFALDETDARVFLELDQLYKKLDVDFATRLENYENHPQLPLERDDVMIEYVTLYNLLGRHEKAYEVIMSHTFRPWEGAEGKITTQYKVALTEMAKEQLKKGDAKEALDLLEKALVYPENLGEGRLEGTKDNNLYYYLGIAKKALGQNEEAEKAFRVAQLGENEPAGMMYYYDQPADMILYKGLAKEELGEKKEAYACFYKLLDYGEQHLRDEMKIDYFAVSLPDFLIFEDDLNKKNKAHCYYLMGLARLGLGDKAEAARWFKEALKYDYNHQNCRIYLKLAE